MNLQYLAPRLLRHFLPEGLTRFLLLRSLIIKPGLETIDPVAAVARYREALSSHGESIHGRRILVFGYGGRFDIGIGLLEAGASYVALCDKYARTDDAHNRRLLKQHAKWLQVGNRAPRPRPDRMTLVEGDARELEVPAVPNRYDLVLSNSVYEHLDDAEGVTAALARWTAAGGRHIHFVDLRDHFFKYPFEMLRYSETTWRRWLNPTSNHNRLRLWDYRRIFEAHFREVEIKVLQRDEAAFSSIRAHIRPEFVSGVAEQDDVTLIRITASIPHS